jgi:hypothetical protein
LGPGFFWPFAKPNAGFDPKQWLSQFEEMEDEAMPDAGNVNRMMAGLL